MYITRLIPRSFIEEMNEYILNEVIEEVIRSTLVSLKRGKILGLNRLTVEFYEGFFYIEKDDLLKTVCEYQRSRKMLTFLNSTHWVLIPKKWDTSTFEDFRVISYFNIIYKLVVKIIAARLKHLFQ
jgi:hypothetical protein